jgi:hypothetical protein
MEDEDHDEPLMGKIELVDPVILEFDCDSIYFGDHNFETLIEACGKKCSFSLDSLLSRWKASKGFRFGVDTSALVHSPIFYKSFKAKKINLAALPNVGIAICNLNNLSGYAMAIYVTYTGSKFIRKLNFFRNEELAVITSALNIMKRILIRDASLPARTRVAFSNMPVFETNVAERDIEQFKLNAKVVLSPEHMKLLY